MVPGFDDARNSRACCGYFGYGVYEAPKGVVKTELRAAAMVLGGLRLLFTARGEGGVRKGYSFFLSGSTKNDFDNYMKTVILSSGRGGYNQPQACRFFLTRQIFIKFVTLSNHTQSFILRQKLLKSVDGARRTATSKLAALISLSNFLCFSIGRWR